jgi:hypothetical protein
VRQAGFPRRLAPSLSALPFIVSIGIAAPVAHAAPAVCIDSYRIDHTDIPDDTAILFHMRDHSVYRAQIQGRCVGLSSDNRGFTYEPIPGSNQICANLLTIRLNTSHGICLVGDIVLVKPAKS